MAPTTIERKDAVWLDDHVRSWVESGVITGSQASAIRELEHLDEVVEPPRLTVVAEVATYLGSVVAFAGGAAIVGPNWDEFGVVGQVVLGLAIAVLGFVAGTWSVRQAEAGAVRLGTFLWVIGTGGVGLAVGAVMAEIDPRNGAWIPLVIGVPVCAIGVTLWRNLDRPLQLATAVVGLALLGAGVMELGDVSVLIASPVVWSAALVFGGLAAFGRVRPRMVALAVSAAGLMLGSFMLADESERLASVVAVATAAMIVGYALYDRSWPLVGIGVLAFFIAITSLMQTVLEGTVARLVAVVAGLAVVTLVAVRAQGRAGGRPPVRGA